MKPHVLVVRQDSMGDVLLAGPAVRAVAGGARRVTLLCGPRGAAAGMLLPGADEVLLHGAAWIDPEPGPLDPGATLRLVDRVAALSADQAFVLTSWHQSPLPMALLLRMARVHQVAGISEDYPGSLLDVRHRVPDDLHEVERSLSLVATLGYRPAPEDDGRLSVTRTAGAVPLPGSGSGGPYIVVHPGTSVPARAWPAQRHADLVSALVARGRRVVVTGSPQEEPLAHRVAGAARAGVVNLCGRTEVAELADVLAGASVVVAGNTGPAHLAAAVGTPVVSLFAPTVPAVRWRPWRIPHVLLGDQHAPCAGTAARTCPVDGHPCLSSVEVQQVLHAVEELEAGSFGGRPPGWPDEAAS